MYLSLMPLPIAVATTSELMLSHSHNAVRIVLHPPAAAAAAAAAAEAPPPSHHPNISSPHQPITPPPQVRIVLLGALVDTWLAKPPILESAAGGTTGDTATAKASGKAPNGSRAKSGTFGTSGDCGDYPSGVAQFWDLLREFLLGDPVKGVRLAVLNAAVQVFIK